MFTIDPKAIPSIDLKELVSREGTLDSRRQSNAPRSHFASRSNGEYELLKVATFQLPQELAEVGPESRKSGQRNIIHVLKRPEREPFYCKPDKFLF